MRIRVLGSWKVVLKVVKRRGGMVHFFLVDGVKIIAGDCMIETQYVQEVKK